MQAGWPQGSSAPVWRYPASLPLPGQTVPRSIVLSPWHLSRLPRVAFRGNRCVELYPQSSVYTKTVTIQLQQQRQSYLVLSVVVQHIESISLDWIPFNKDHFPSTSMNNCHGGPVDHFFGSLGGIELPRPQGVHQCVGVTYRKKWEPIWEE